MENIFLIYSYIERYEANKFFDDVKVFIYQNIPIILIIGLIIICFIIAIKYDKRNKE